uniref:Uncharacterized protein n=1 Tax=Clytia hemisphaerica TaxID=252671 RepID=A0A7M5UVD5_9CNID
MISLQSILLVACVALASATQYNLEFEENGSKYNERIIVDKKKGFLLYDVPKHGDIEAAKFLKDFNTRFNVLRDAALKICYIWKMKGDEPTPDSIEDGLKMVQGHFPNNKFLVENDEIFAGPELKEDSLSALMKQFCQGMQKLSIVRKSSKDMEQILKQQIIRKYSGRSKRDTVHHVVEYKPCNAATMVPELEKCNSCNRMDLIKLNCDITYTKYCGYTVRRGMWTADCTKSTSGRHGGFECRLPSHTRATVKCCRLKCPLANKCNNPPPNKKTF